MTGFGKLLILMGSLMLLIGIFFYLAGDKLKWIGHLPGDFRYEKEGFGFYLPLATSLILSFVLSGVFWLISKFIK